MNSTATSRESSEVGISQANRRKALANGAFSAVIRGCLLVAIVALVALISYVVSQGGSSFGPRLWQRFPSLSPRLAGARSAVLGTVWVISLTALIAVPVGVGAALYLEEFARKDRWYNQLIDINLQNLAAVPSIVYGILGLAFIARGPLNLGPVILTGSLILALLVLPIIVIASREAIRAVPSTIRQAGLALGATQWQTVSRQVLPAATPGIATAVILALSRAIGEAAPLIMIGAFTYVPFEPTGLSSEFTVLPIQIFDWIGRPQDGFTKLAAAASLMLLLILIAMNSIAIVVRNRFHRHS